MVSKNIKLKGFTIVELLIVIVVVGILAAITIVSYSGISGRANTSTNLANANAVMKAAESVRGDTSITSWGGFYPDPSATVANQITSLNRGTAKIPTNLQITGKYSADTTGTMPNGSNLLYVIKGTAITFSNADGICVYYFDASSNVVRAISSGNASPAASALGTATMTAGSLLSSATCS